ncbi:SGNH/GDSL hydrolase family protein [Emticicia soli]|uniref:SGNH/GDSL hydrolase family protein n=1 Tax=Emticicia soli TaxID=2027878 RepID=A0ABW5JDT4_9BACT
MFWFLLISLLILLVLSYAWLWQKITKDKPKSYPTPQNRQQLDASKKTLVCFGDSNTHGNVSYNWVSDVAKDFPDIQVLNAGLNSDLAYSLLQRIDDVIACKPDFVTILVGTNDVNATMTKELENSYKQTGKIPQDMVPDFALFKKYYQEIINRLKQETKAKIGVMSLPVMSEDLTYEANKKADKYSEYISELAQKQKLTYLPLREKQKDFLLVNPKPLKHTFDETFKLLIFSVINHYILGKDWDYSSKRHGYQLTPDNLHQNSVSGRMIRDLVRDFIKVPQ